MHPTIPKYPVVAVPEDEPVTIRCVRVPKEVPTVGVIDGSAMQVEIGDTKYQIIHPELGTIISTLHEAIDVETGDIVYLQFPGSF